jgi:hypothetical protein
MVPSGILTFNYKLSSVQIVIQAADSKQEEKHIFGEEGVYLFDPPYWAISQL